MSVDTSVDTSVDALASCALGRRIKAFSALGAWLQQCTQAEKEDLCTKAQRENSWFSRADVLYALEQVGAWLAPAQLEAWTQQEQQWLSPSFPERQVALLLAGNIPLVGFHDVLCTLLCGHTAHIKASHKDSFLLGLLSRKLLKIDSLFAKQLVYTQALKDTDSWDALIATGEDHTLQVVASHTKAKNLLLRGQRGSCAILHGGESRETQRRLGEDVFRYYGLGCRSVSLLYVPASYRVGTLVKAWEGFSSRGRHIKYRNHYRHKKALYASQKQPFIDGGFFLLREDPALFSPLAVVHYQRYTDEEAVRKLLLRGKQPLQVIVSEGAWWEGSVPIGNAQTPALGDYADGIHTLKFLQTANTF